MPGTEQTAASLVESGKGILAADESIATMSKRLEAAGIQPSADSRRDYREMLLRTPGLAQWVSGIIFCDETLRQKARDGASMPSVAAGAGIQAGIKVDGGVTPLAFTDGEVVTEGLDGLRARLEEYRSMDATFAKWRAVLVPLRSTERGIHANAHALARYGALCQEAGMVPIVEPEVLMDGAHGIHECAGLTSYALGAVFSELSSAGVEPSGMVLKPNMVVAGSSRSEGGEPQEVARLTLEVLLAAVPRSLAGIAFLSGGQSNLQACANLAAINQQAAGRGDVPWRLTYSFGRALVDDALHTWKGDVCNDSAAQQVLAANCERASRASMGLDTEPARHG